MTSMHHPNAENVRAVSNIVLMPPEFVFEEDILQQKIAYTRQTAYRDLALALRAVDSVVKLKNAPAEPNTLHYLGKAVLRPSGDTLFYNLLPSGGDRKEPQLFVAKNGTK